MSISDTNRTVSQFESASQEYFKETWEFGWTLIGVACLLILTFFGIYFSQVALSAVIGGVGIMLYFTWSASISISALEVAGIKLLGHEFRSLSIKANNKAEHTIAKWFTYGLFLFDIFTNWAGLYITATLLLPEGNKLTTAGWVVIICFGSLMAISEILVGWMIRAVATSYVSYKHAEQKYSTYKRAMEKDVLNSISRETSSSKEESNDTNRGNRGNNNGNKGSNNSNYDYRQQQ